MARKQAARPQRYHHGDLRRALVDQAMALVRDKGMAGLTLRGVARAAGVSNMAPYHHFADKTALVAEVAREGFERLRAAMEAEMARGRSPEARLQRTAVGAVRFAVSNPELYRVMFGPALADKSDHPDLAAAASAALATVEDAVTRCRQRGVIGRRDARVVAVASWSLVHGLSMLLIDRQLGRGATNPREAERLAIATTDLLFTGLQIRG